MSVVAGGPRPRTCRRIVEFLLGGLARSHDLGSQRIAAVLDERSRECVGQSLRSDRVGVRDADVDEVLPTTGRAVSLESRVPGASPRNRGCRATARTTAEVRSRLAWLETVRSSPKL